MAELFTRPSPDQLAEIGRELKLTTERAHELALVIQHVHEDLEGYYRTRIGRGPRKDRMDRLRAVDQALEKLIVLLGKNPDEVNDDLPFDAREAIAWAACSELISVVTGEVVSEAGVRIPHKEKSAGLRHGARILVAQLQLIREPIQEVLSEESSDPGGLEPNHVRVMLIRALAAAAPDILGAPATGTAGGDFARLVDAVFRGLEINTDGLEKAIERILYRKSVPPKAAT